MNTGKTPSYQPQMDGLRAVAIVFVMIHHFGASIPQWLNWGTLGVRFFFVLSGFLITRILLKSRARLEGKNGHWWPEYRVFQMRRLVRTLPPYYLFLAVASALAIPPVRETLGWTLPFLTNFLIVKTGYFPDTVSHFWSLAVQEQFYFVWPWLIFFLPRKWLNPTFILLILSGLLFRYGCIVWHVLPELRWVSLPASLDTFAIGGLLAWFSQSHPQLLPAGPKRVWTGVGAVGLLIVSRQLRLLPLDNFATIWIELFEAIFMGWLVACSVTGFQGFAGRVLSSPPLTYIGGISYGIYVYHILVVILLAPWLQRFGMIKRPQQTSLGFFAVEVLITCGVAALSWHWIEQPLLRARERLAAFRQSRGTISGS